MCVLFELLVVVEFCYTRSLLPCRRTGVTPPAPRIARSRTFQGSIVKSIEKASVEANFQILVSIYNPNTLDAKIQTGTAVLLHKHIEVRASKQAYLHFLLQSLYGGTYRLHTAEAGVCVPSFYTGAWLAGWGRTGPFSGLTRRVGYVRCYWCTCMYYRDSYCKFSVTIFFVSFLHMAEGCPQRTKSGTFYKLRRSDRGCSRPNNSLSPVGLLNLFLNLLQSRLSEESMRFRMPCSCSEESG